MSIIHHLLSDIVDMLTDATSREVLIGLDPPSTNTEGQCSHLLCQLWPFRRVSLCRLLCRRSKKPSTSQQQNEKGDNEEAFFLKKHDALDEGEEDHEVAQRAVKSLHNSHEGKGHGYATPTLSTTRSMTVEAVKTDPVQDYSTPPTEKEEQQDMNDKDVENGKQWKKKSHKHKWSHQKNTVVESLWILQFILLFHRTFNRSRKRLLSKLVLFQVSYIHTDTISASYCIQYYCTYVRTRATLLLVISVLYLEQFCMVRAFAGVQDVLCRCLCN